MAVKSSPFFSSAELINNHTETSIIHLLTVRPAVLQVVVQAQPQVLSHYNATFRLTPAQLPRGLLPPPTPCEYVAEELTWSGFGAFSGMSVP